MASQCNLKGQETKLLTDKSYHEYLRVLGCKDGKLRGCLARSCATFVNGNWETDRMIGFDSKLHEIYSNVAVLERRGALTSKAQAVWEQSFFRAAKNYKWSNEDAAKYWRMTCGEKIVVKSGGEAGIGGEKQKSDQIQKLPGEKLDFSKLEDNVTRPYVNRLLTKLPDWVEPNRQEVKRLKAKLQQATYGTELPVAFQMVERGDLKLKQRQFKIEESVPINIRTAGKRAEAYKADWRVRNHIRAYHVLLSTIKMPNGYSEVDVLSSMTGFSTTVIRASLALDNIQIDKGRSRTNGGRRLAAEAASLLDQFNWVEQAWGDDKVDDYNDLEIELQNYARVLASDVMKY